MKQSWASANSAKGANNISTAGTISLQIPKSPAQCGVVIHVVVVVVLIAVVAVLVQEILALVLAVSVVLLLILVVLDFTGLLQPASWLLVSSVLQR